jgi:hypothetical protein
MQLLFDIADAKKNDLIGIEENVFHYQHSNLILF